MGKIYAGTSGWAYATWKPTFYPAKLASVKFLGYYSTRLNSVELNYTFRRRVSEKLLDGWIAATPTDFRFAVKAHQTITHITRLRGSREVTLNFIASLDPLRQAGKLGPILFQLPPFLKCDIGLLEDFLAGLPRNTLAAMEFRHVSWFSLEVYERLRGANVALCQAESDKLDTPDVATADFRYYRLRKETYTAAARKALAQQIDKAARSGDVFVYFKHEDSPEGALQAEGLLTENKSTA
jgi:uncharacterized protein YecE (DUF72 family)